MKKNKVCVYIAIGFSLLLFGCNVDRNETVQENSEENIEVESSGLEIVILDEEVEEEEIITFDFLDVYGESYTAELLQNIPMHSYDYSQLNNDEKLYSYTDEDGIQTSMVGIDVSKYQGNIDWQAVKDEGIEFVIIRLGYRGYGEEGVLAIDEMFYDNIKGALDVGLEVGVYFFSQAITADEALEEAEFVIDIISEYDITMPVVFDTEIVEVDGARTLDIDKSIFTEACIVFCDRIIEEGYDTMIYFNLVWSAFTLDLEQLTSYEKWYADYYDIPQYPYEFTMWQYTETAQVSGIEGYVDLNILFIK